jgi:prepilin-type N-terminal cleavage/methylation domain-containing protein
VPRTRRGFTLIEGITAVVIIGAAMPPMMWSLRQAQYQRMNAVQASKARWLTCEKLEDIIADRHSTTRGYAYLVAANYPAETTVTNFPGFSRSVTLVETTANLTTVSAGGGFMKVTVSTSYNDASQVARTVSLSSIVTNYTP